MRLIPGDRFGPYVIQSELGRGGQAVVYRAEQTDLERRVALKVFESSAVPGTAALDRFRREAVAAARVEHPRIVPIYDAGEIDGQPFIAMRLIDGASLSEEITRTGPLPPAQAVALLDDIAQALDFAHANGLTHRDLKPGNILLDRKGAAYLSDFGVARLDDRPGMTRPGDWLGTAEYLSPEQIEGQASTKASDIYGFACLAYEVLSGRPPFVRREATAVLVAHTRDTAPPAHEINPRLPAEVDRVLASGLAKRPEDRPKTAQAFVNELRTALSSQASRLTMVGAAPIPLLTPEDPWNSALERFSKVDAAATASVDTTAALPFRLPPPDDPGPGTGKVLRGKGLVVVAVTAALFAAGLAVGGYFFGHSQADTGSARAEGYASGRQAGLTAGRQQGIEMGIGRGKTIGRRTGYQTGYKKGFAAGASEGQSTGYSDGYTEGRKGVFSGFDTPWQSNSTYLVSTDTDSTGIYINSRSSDPIPFGTCLQTGNGGAYTQLLSC